MKIRILKETRPSVMLVEHFVIIVYFVVFYGASTMCASYNAENTTILFENGDVVIW